MFERRCTEGRIVGRASTPFRFRFRVLVDHRVQEAAAQRDVNANQQRDRLSWWELSDIHDLPSPSNNASCSHHTASAVPRPRRRGSPLVDRGVRTAIDESEGHTRSQAAVNQVLQAVRQDKRVLAEMMGGKRRHSQVFGIHHLRVTLAAIVDRRGDVVIAGTVGADTKVGPSDCSSISSPCCAAALLRACTDIPAGHSCRTRRAS